MRQDPLAKVREFLQWWAGRHSNPQPDRYERPALTDCATGPEICREVPLRPFAPAEQLPAHSARRLLGQNALECAPVHIEAARGLRDIAAANLVNPLDMLPPHAVGGHRIFRQLWLVLARCHQSIEDLIGIGGLCQIIEGSELD